MLHGVGGMGDYAGNEYLAVGESDVLPDLPLVGVTWLGDLRGIGPGLHRQDQVDYVLEREIGCVRPVPATPAQVVAYPVRRNVSDGVFNRFDTQ